MGQLIIMANKLKLKQLFVRSKCRMAYPHDFPDYPCKKCNSKPTIFERFILWTKTLVTA